MKKVLTMTLNPCMDKTMYFERFQAGATNVAKKVMEEAAGKGINVAVGLQHLQVPVKALGFAYKEDAYKMYAKLDAERVPYSFVEVDGRLRVNQKLFDESKSEMTECNEKGTPVTKEDIAVLMDLLQQELQDAGILVLSGSVPPGVAADVYAVMTEMANAAGVKVVLDAAGELLAVGVKAKPYLIKPNKDEFVNTFIKNAESTEMTTEMTAERTTESKKGEVSDAIMAAIAGRLIAQGVSHVCLSMGAEGAVLWSQSVSDKASAEKVFVEAASKDAITGGIIGQKSPAIPVTIRSLQGAGDAMVAGLCKAIYEKEEEKMLEYALSMAASTIMLEGTQMGDFCYMAELERD